MLELNNRIKNLIKRPAFALFVLAVLLWISIFDFSFVEAQVKTLPLKSISISAGGILSEDEMGWQHGDFSIINELGDHAGLVEFTQENSAYLKIGDFDKLVTPMPAGEGIQPPLADQPPSSSESTSATEVPPAADQDAAMPASQDMSGGVKNNQTPSVQENGEATADKITEAPESVVQTHLVEHSIVLKDFSLATEQQAGVISNVQLRLSLAAKQLGSRDQLKMFYDTGEGWQDAGNIDIKDETNNGSNNGYFLFALPTFASWEDLQKLQIKLSFVGDVAQSAAEVYVDSAWIEVDYQDSGTGEEIAATQDISTNSEDLPLDALEPAQDFELNQISPESNFKTSDNPDFNFVFKRKHKGVKGFVQGLFGKLFDEYSGLDIKTELKDSVDNLSDLGVQVDYLANGEFKIRVNKNKRNFRPGKYKLAIEVNDGGQIYTKYQDFSWGVLAVNTSKSVYSPTERAYLQFGVLDDSGNTLCNSDLFMEITAPDGGVAYLDTYNGLIERNPLCGPNNVIDTPDYFAHYGLAGVGIYKIKLTARTPNGDKIIYDQFEVRDAMPFNIERVGPTRIWPWANYQMKLSVKASENYEGNLTEIVPNNFSIVSERIKINNQEIVRDIDGGYTYSETTDGVDNKYLTWGNLKINAGDNVEASYVFDAPDVSPEFYFLGPATIGGFTEARQWQIAGDAATTSYMIDGSSTAGWRFPAFAYDNSSTTVSSTTVSANTNASTTFLRATSSNAIDLGGVISKVEVGLSYFASTTGVYAVIRPVFAGIATGTATSTQAPTVMSTNFVDITYASSTWTWNDVMKLDLLVHASNTRAFASVLSVGQIYIRVTYNNAPAGLINAVTQRSDGSGVVDFSTTFSDVDRDNTRARIDYVANSNCDFTGTPLIPVLNATGITEDYGTTSIDNNAVYQLGTTSNWIYTASGTDNVGFSWNSKNVLNNLDGTYCVRVTANDLQTNQTIPATSTLKFDNKNPDVPGIASLATTSFGNEVKINFGTYSADTNFQEYKVFYKIGTSTVTESDLVFDKIKDINLDAQDLNGASSVLIGDLDAKTIYSFAIWAYDSFGNKSSSTQVSIGTVRAVPARANTVYFPAGRYSGIGSGGQNTDTDQRLTAFDFSLAEAGAKIQNAYIILDTRFEAYANNPGNYTGYKLAFDACQKPCSPDAFAGTGGGNIYQYDSSTLAYHSTANAASNARLILDVTKEAEMASYSGSSTQMSAQVGYRLERGGATTSIAFARAMLVVTYKHYDSQDINYTNTVVYPLKSTNAGDTGTRRALMNTLACTPGAGATCPRFNYKMNIPDYKNRLTQWYETYNEYRGNANAGLVDVTVEVDVVGPYALSPFKYYHEMALNNGQGALPAIYFDNVTGFAENATQTMEYSAQGGLNGYYGLGGEVVETYIASSSATTKTRTVSFPMGVITNGGLITMTPATTSVYFPENGAATGTVSVKEAWFRIIPNFDANSTQGLSVST